MIHNGRKDIPDHPVIAAMERFGEVDFKPRRAKCKLLNGKRKMRVESGELTVDSAKT